ncbi:MAG: MFS transporter [Burkholderiales bacterium]|nr:MFS transporter [Burkholderiales bacterium]
MPENSTATGVRSQLITIYQLMFVVVLWNSAYKGGRVLNTLYALELGATPLHIGLLLATYGVFPLLLAVLAGRIADRHGARVPVILGMLVCTLGIMLPWFAPSLPLLFVAAAVTGFGFILGQVAFQSLVGLLGEGEARTRNFNNYALIVAVADFVGPVFAGFSIDHAGHVPTYLFLGLLGATSVIAIIVLAKRIPRHRRPAPAPAGQRMTDLFRDADMRRVLIASAVVMTGIDLFQLYIPLYGHQIGLSASAIGMILGAAAVATFVSRALLPTLVSRYSEEKTLLYALFLTAAMFMLIPFFKSAIVLAAICFTLGLGMGLGQPLTVVLCYRYSPAGRAGESLGLRIAINNSMHVVVPALFGAVGAAFGLAPVFWANAGVIAAGNWYARKRAAGETG